MISDIFNELKGSYPNQVKAFIRKTRNSFSVFQDTYSEFREAEFRPKNDYDSFGAKMRAEGTIWGIQKAKEVLSGICPVKDIEAYFLFANAQICNGGYNYVIDEYNQIVLSAAIWILDELTISGKLEELFPLLHSVDLHPDDLKLPGFRHPVYDQLLILELTELIRHRNTLALNDNPAVGSIRRTEEKNDPNAQKNREAFDAVLDLIRPESKQAATEHYEEKIWEFYRIAFGLMYASEKRVKALEDDANELYVQNEYGSKHTKASEISFSSLEREQIRRQIQINELIMKRDAIERNASFTSFAWPNNREHALKELKGVVPQKTAQACLNYHVDDPFECAFALLYLLDQNSLIPWMYYGSIAVAYSVIDQLPFRDEPDGIDTEPDLNPEWNAGLYQHKFDGIRYATDVAIADNEVSHSEQQYTHENAKNLSQVVYENTGILMPRVLPKQQGLQTFLEDIRAQTDREKEAYTLLYSVLSVRQLQNQTDLKYRLHKYLDEFFDEEADSDEDGEEDSEEIWNEYNRLKEKNSAISSALRTALSEKKEQEKYIRELQTEINAREKELADLREAIFQIGHSDDEESVNTSEITYPYHIEKRIVCFGGHASWLKEMRRRFPSVIFVDPDTLPNLDLIRYADAIWLQTNCMSHKFFFRIIGMVRNIGKELKYYSYASADKCAKQMVQALETIQEK